MASKILQSNDEKHQDFAEKKKQLKTNLDLEELQILI